MPSTKNKEGSKNVKLDMTEEELLHMMVDIFKPSNMSREKMERILNYTKSKFIEEIRL